MKKILFKTLFLASMVSNLTCCTNVDKLDDPSKRIIIKATIDDNVNSRFALGESDATSTKIKWDFDDVIEAYNGSTFKVANISEDGKTATFTYDEESEPLLEKLNSGESLKFKSSHIGENYKNLERQPGTKEEVANFLLFTAFYSQEGIIDWNNINLTFTHNYSILKINLAHPDLKINDEVNVTLKTLSTDVTKVKTSSPIKVEKEGEIEVYFTVNEDFSNVTVLVEPTSNENIYTAFLGSKDITAGNFYITGKMELELENNGENSSFNITIGDLSNQNWF